MNKELWDWGDEQQEQESQAPKRSLFDNLGDAITAIGANFSDVRGSNNIGDLRHDLMENGATMPLEEYNRKVAELEQLYGEREASRQKYQQAHDNLVADDSFLKNLTEMGGTIEGMAAQGIGTAVGAGLGLVGGVGGAAMGAKIGNAAGAVAGGYLDARSVALQAEEDVLDKGGTWEQARHAYDEALKKASLTTLPETLADIALGNRLVRAGLNSGMARKIAGSTIGRAGSAVLDPAAKIGTKAALKSSSTLVGRGAGILADTALQGSTEAGQEVLQDYIENREVAKAMGREDNEYSLGGFKDYALSDEGLETMKTAGIMGALFGGVGGTLSSGQYLTRGAETNTGIRAHNNTEKMINDGTLKIDKERRQDEEKIISALTGISPTELATWSDADIVAEASILEGQYMGVIGEAEDMSTTRGAADVVRRLTSKEDNTIHREGDVTETSRAFLKGMGVDDKMLEGMFNSPVEKSLMEKARKEEEQAAKQEKTGEKPQATATLTAETGEQMKKTEGKTAIENIKEEAQQNKAETPTVTETVTEKSTQNNLAQAAQQQEQQGKIDTSDNIVYKDNLMGGWETDPDMVDEDEMFDQHSYYNIHTEKTATIARATDGGFVVKTQVNANTENIPHFNTLKEAENYLFTNKDNVNFQESNGEQTKEGTTEDPNIVPKDGVDASGQNHSGALINSVDDLFNFMQQNPGLLSRGEFIEFVHAKHNLGVNDLSMYLDRKNEGRVYNEQTGQWGYVNAKKMRDEATGRAIIQLYRGGDIVSAVHEIAHVGYENLSDQDKTTFNRYAVKSMGQWIADMLDVNYDDTLRQRLHNLQNDEELRKKIEDSPALRQTVIAFLNAEQNGVDINHLTADQIRAIDERWAWEFSMWYTEGYMRGVEPQNILQRIYQRGIFSLGDQLNMLQRLWEHIHHKDNQDIESLYTDKMNASAERPNTSGQTASPDMRFTSELEMTQMPNVNTGMNFGGEQAIQYNIPTLGESYNDAQEYAGLYNELERRYANRQKNKGLPSADGSVATNKQRPTNSEGTRTTTTGYKERTTVPAKNKKEAEKLVKIIEGKKSGWEKALEKLAYVDPKRFRSVKVESGNDLWNDQQEKNIENISKMNFTTTEIGARPLHQTNFTMPNLEAQPMNESVTRANGINTGRPLYFNPLSEETIDKWGKIREEEEEKQEKEKQQKEIDKKIEYVDKNFKGVKGLSNETKEVVYETYKQLLKGNDQVSSLSKENAVIYARICDRLANMYNENEKDKKYTAKDIYEQIQLQITKRPSSLRGTYSVTQYGSNIWGKVVDLSNRIIKTFQGASPSTFLHETTHMYFYELELLANKYPNSQAAKDYKLLIDFTEYKGKAEEEKYANSLGEMKSKIARAYINEVENAKGKTNKGIALEIYRQEKLAQSFEEYLREGKTPIKELASIFKKFKDWVRDFFGMAEAVGVKPSTEIREFYDRMIMTDNEIKERNEQKQIKEQQKQQQKAKQAVENTTEKEAQKEETSQPKQKEQQQTEQEKPTLSTDEIYSHLYFGDKSGKLKYNEKTKKIEFFNNEYIGRNPDTMKKMYKTVKKGEITQDQYNELRTRYEKDFKAVKGENKSLVPDLVEGMPKDDFMYAAYREVEKKTRPVELGQEKQTLVTGKNNEYSRNNSIEQSIQNLGNSENLNNLEEIGETNKEKEEEQRLREELRQQSKQQENQTPTQETTSNNKTTTPANKPNKTTKSNTKQTNPLDELHKKYKNITGTPIGEKGYRFKDDEKQFITAFKQNIDRAVGNKEELLKVSKQLDGWFQNNPTERNRMVRKYLSNYLVDAGQIKVDDGVRNQETNRAEQTQEILEKRREYEKKIHDEAVKNKEILDKALPNTRFQIASHSGKVDFQEFSLAYLGTGVGDQVHGHGVYVSLAPNAAKGYFDIEKKDMELKEKLASKKPGKIMVNGVDKTESVRKLIYTYERNLGKIENENRLKMMLFGAMRNADAQYENLRKQKETIEEKGLDTYQNMAKSKFLQKQMDLVEKDADRIERMIDDIERGKIKVEYDIKFKNSPTLYIVNVPDIKYMIEETATFDKQPKEIKQGIIKTVKQIYKTDNDGALKILRELPLMHEIGEQQSGKIRNPFIRQNHHPQIYWDLVNQVARSYGKKRSEAKKYVSELLNKNGVQGIHYYGQRDGECAVIFNDKAIDILNKFQRFENKWKKLNKVDNARNRQADLEKAQRKLEKRRQRDDGTRFQLHSENGLSKADTNSPEFKRWFNGSILTNKDGSPKTFYRGFQQHYDPTYDKEEGGVVWIADKRQFAEDFRDTIIEEEPSYNKKTGKFDGKMIKTTMISRGANVEKGDIAEVYANIKNPFDVKEIMRYASDHDQYVYIGKMLKRDVDNGIITEQQRKQVLTDLMYLNKKNKRGEFPSTVHALAHHFTNKKFFDALKKVGYDSIKGVEGDSMTYGVFEKGNVKSIYNKGTFDANNKDIRFQAASVSRKGMNEQELDNDYKQIFRGVAKDNYELEDKDIDRILNKYFKTTGDKVFNSERDEDANLFLEINDAINNFYWHDNKLQRGLDGRWRYYIDDRKMKVKKGVDKFFDSPQKLDGRSYPINQLIEHDELFKDYPELAKIRIGFEYNKNEQAAGYYDKKQDKITINPNSYMFKMGQNERKFKRILVHELQHVIQETEGFSKGGDPLQFMGFDEKHEKLFRDLVQTVYENKDYLVDFVKQTYGKQDAKLMEEIVSDPMDIDYLLRSDEDPNISSQIFDYIEKSGVAFDKYESLLGEIEARDASNRLDMSDEQYNSTKPLDTDFRYNRLQDEYGQVIVSGANKKKDNGTRYQESTKQDKSEEREEKEYNKRKERVEKAKEEGTLSDQMKDVYSVSFTKSAQEYAENRTKMEYFDNNEDYWDRTEDKSTGKVTYVRKTPYEHQQKVVTYNGVNDVKRENKKKSKPAQWMEWMKDQLIKYMFNDKHYLAKAARKLGVYDAYRRMIVTEGYALKANTALTQGIKYNGKTTRALNDIIRDVGEPKQKAFLKYCIAHRILDLKNRENPVFQKMKPDEARKYIEEIKASPDAELFERNRKDFVEYNKALLHVLVDGGIMDEKTFQKFCDVDPNFVPLAKVMDDADFGFNSIINAHNLVNLKSPIKKIGTSMLEIANPFLEMQKRTAEYYAIASRNKAGQIFVNEIAGALEKTTEGDVIARGQGMLRRVRVDERNGQLITKPDDKQQIIYVCNNGKHEFYQVADKEIYQALTFMNADQMGTIHKMLDNIAHVPSGLVRETATMVPDFGVRNVIRDGGEAFLTSEHGFLPVIDQIWGMWQVMNNTEWAQMYFNQNGEYGTLNRDRVNSEGIASVDDVIDEKLNPLKNFKEIKQAQMAILKDKQRQFSILTDIKDGNFGDAWEHTRKSRGVAALKLAISPLWAIGKSNKRMNDLFELGTRVGEFKNAKMGFEGTLDRIARGIMNTNLKEAELQKKAQSDVYAAHVAKDITLNFSQHGKLGKELNRYIPFFNASLQGIYKLCNTLETMVTGTTISGGKNRRLQQELLFKAALITAVAVGVAAAGDGDEDYEEAPDYEKENFWILPNGLRFPKDQVLGKIIGNTVEKSYAQWKKGKAEPSTILKSILENFSPDRFMFAIFDLAIGGFGNYDTFKQRAIVPEYMADKLGHLQKDISTSNFAVDVSEALWKCGFDISAKKIDWALQKNFSNCAKYATSIYDLGKKTFNPKEFNERIARGYDKNDSTGSIVAGLKDDIPSPISLVSGTFATNRSTFKSISDFYENYKKYKKLSSDEASMSKEDKRMWKRYEQAYKKDMTFRKQLRAIKQDRTLTGKQKREKADKIFKQQIKLAKWAEG